MFLSGCLFLVLSVTPVRAWLIGAIPMSQKIAISAGIGLFLGVIALKDAGHRRRQTRRPWSRSAISRRRRRCSPPPGSSSWSRSTGGGCRARSSSRCSATAAAGILLARLALRRDRRACRRASPRPSSRSTCSGALDLGVATIVFVFLFVDLFDNTGTLVGVAYRAGLIAPRRARSRASTGCWSPIRPRRSPARCSAPRP